MAQVRCTVLSGSRQQNLTALLYNCLSTFGNIGQIKYKQGTEPTFIVSFTDMDMQDASDIINTLDGQYIDVGSPCCLNGSNANDRVGVPPKG